MIKGVYCTEGINSGPVGVAPSCSYNHPAWRWGGEGGLGPERTNIFLSAGKCNFPCSALR